MLAAGEYFHLLGAGFAAEHKGAEQVAYLVADVALCYIVDGLEDGEVFIEQRGLVLRKIAYLHIVAELKIAFVL